MYLDSNDARTIDRLGMGRCSFFVEAAAVTAIVMAIGGAVGEGIAARRRAVQAQQEHAATVVAWLRAQETQKIALEQARAAVAKKTQQNVLMIGGAAVALVAGYFLLK